MRQCAGQVSLFELRDAQGEPCLPERYTVSAEPLSVRSLVDALGGTQRSGQQRALLQADLEQLLWRLYVHAWAVLDSEERAAAVLLHVCARDPGYEPPAWVVDLWREYRDNMVEHFHGSADDRHTDWSEGQASE